MNSEIVLSPNCSVVQFVLAGESGSVIVPAVLSGQSPPPHPDTSTLGTGNHSRTPQAVLLGGAFDDAAIAALRNAVQDAPEARRVPWIGQDFTIDAPPVTSPEYIKAVVQRSKDKLSQLEREGKLDGSYDGIELY